MAILTMVVVLGFFLPPASIILMTAPIILPPLRSAGFDLIWFGVVMTIVMEMGLIHPPVGLKSRLHRKRLPPLSLGHFNTRPASPGGSLFCARHRPQSRKHRFCAGKVARGVCGRHLVAALTNGQLGEAGS